MTEPETRPQPAPSFFGAVRVVAVFTLLSRFLGLIRDVVMARVLGDTVVGSAFAFAFLIPNLFRRLFGEGALTAAFLPEYASLVEKDPELSNRFATLAFSLLFLLTGVITVVGIAALLLIRELSPENPDRAYMLTLAMVMLPYMPLICAVAVTGAILQVHGRFAPMAAAPLLLNAVTIGAALLAYAVFRFNATSTAFIVAIAVVCSGVLQLAWTLFSVRRYIAWRRGFASVREPARRMARRFGPALVGLGTLQLNTLLDGVIAAWPLLVGPTILGIAYPLDEASNAILTYTQRLYQFPLGVFGIAVATAVFPLLSRAADRPAEFADTLRRGLRLSLYIGLPASAGLFLVRDDLTFVLLRGENFSLEGATRAASVLMGYSLAVWAYSANQLFVRAFYARGDTVTPVKVALGAMLVNLALNLTLIWVPGLREGALAWSTAISATLQMVVLARLTRSKLLPEAPLLDADTRRSVARSLVLTVAMSAGVGATLWLFPAPPVGEGDLTHPLSIARLASAVGVGGVAYLALSVALKAPELRWLLQRSAR